MKNARILYITALFSILFFGLRAGEVLGQDQGNQGQKKAVMIVPQKNFRDEELFEPKQVLEKNGLEVKVASTTQDYVKGMLGKVVKPDMLVSDINVADFDAVIFIGGQGASQYWNDPQAQGLAQQAYNSGIVVAAICMAPVTLANAGILEGKHATVSSFAASQIKAQGAIYTDEAVVRDANIITASGPDASYTFGEQILAAIEER